MASRRGAVLWGDWVLRRWYGVVEFSSSDHCVFRIEVTCAHGNRAGRRHACRRRRSDRRAPPVGPAHAGAGTAIAEPRLGRGFSRPDRPVAGGAGPLSGRASRVARGQGDPRRRRLRQRVRPGAAEDARGAHAVRAGLAAFLRSPRHAGGAGQLPVRRADLGLQSGDRGAPAVLAAAAGTLDLAPRARSPLRRGRTAPVGTAAEDVKSGPWPLHAQRASKDDGPPRHRPSPPRGRESRLCVPSPPLGGEGGDPGRSPVSRVRWGS